MKHIMDYLYKRGERLVSPLWAEKREFGCLCLGYLKVAEALGFETYQATPVLRLVKENQINDEDDFDNWVSRHKFDYSLFKEELENLNKLKSEEVGLYGGGCFGPLTVVSCIIGAEKMLRFVRTKPQFIKKFVETVTTYLVELAKVEESEGAQFFWIAEPVASLISPKNFWDFSGCYIKEIYDSIKIPGFLHVCGKTLPHTEYMEKTGAQVLSIDYLTDIGKCIRMVDKNTVIMGNVDPSLLKEGSVNEVEEEVLRINEECRNYKNFIMATGCSVVDGTPDENMQKLFKVTQQYPIWTNEEYKVIQYLVHLLKSGLHNEFQEYINSKNINTDLINVVKKEFDLISNIRLNLKMKK